MKPLNDLVGKRFGSLVVVGRAFPNYRGNAVWSCICDCGTSKNLIGTVLARTKSCGCLRRKNADASLSAALSSSGATALPNWRHEPITGDFPFSEVLSLRESDGRLFWKVTTANHAEKIGKEAGYPLLPKGKNKSYWQIRMFGRTFRRSRVVFYMTHGRWPLPMVDHINGDSLDDRPDNLRECTPSQNTVNSRLKSRKHQLPRGVYPTKRGRYMARITVNGRSVSLGVFGTIEAAQSAYTQKRSEAFGEFA